MPLLYAIFLWWFTTGVIVAISRRAQGTRRVSFFIGSVLMVPALIALILGARNPGPYYVYITFTCGVLIWGWLVAGYYFDIITGPPVHNNALQQPQDIQTRFRLALRGSLYHELLIVTAALILTGLTWSQPNRWGLWIFLVLWIMHTSAKLSIFLGVRNFRIDFLPIHLRYAQGLLGQGQTNRLLPVSVCLAVSVALTLLYQAIRPVGEAGDAVGSMLVATMLILGIIEHVLLVLPLPLALFGWGVRSLSDPASDQAVAKGGSRLENSEIPPRSTRRQALPLAAYVEQHGERSQA
jgi:putative photosynthetic complex assembly protein 2